MHQFQGATVTRMWIDVREKRHSGAVYDGDGTLVAESLRPADRYKILDPERLDEALSGRSIDRHLPRALYLGHAFRHFGHFLIETVPTLNWLSQADPSTPLIFHAFDRSGRHNIFAKTPYGAECLRLLNVDPNRIVIADSDIAVGELLVAPRPYAINKGPRRDFRGVYMAMRKAALAEGPAGHRRVYLSRSRLVGGEELRLADEALIDEHFAARGFRIVYPETLTFGAQIRAVAEADIVAGTDGSALHLSAFMRPGSLMLVLATGRRPNIELLNNFMDVKTKPLRAKRVERRWRAIGFQVARAWVS